MLAGAAPFYDNYETSDGKFVALGAIEPQFYALLLDRLGLVDDPDLADQKDRARWPAGKAKIAAAIRSRTREDLCAVLEGSDACFAPVLSRAEAPSHPHNQARGTFVEAFGLVQPAPAPRYSESTTRAPFLAAPGSDATDLLKHAGYSPERITDLMNRGVVGQADAAL